MRESYIFVGIILSKPGGIISVTCTGAISRVNWQGMGNSLRKRRMEWTSKAVL